MQLTLLMISFSTISAMLSIFYKKKFLLSMLMALELIMLNLVIFNILSALKLKKSLKFSFSLFILTLSAVEASIGMSILALISRKFSTKNMFSTNLLKK